MRRLSQYFLLASILAMWACANDIPRGHLKEDESFSAIKVGVTTKDEALKALGSPSSQSSFGPMTWYYISAIQQRRAMLAPKIVDQRVTEITFSDTGVVNGINTYSLADAKNVEIASRTTPAEGQQLGFFEQIFSNLGRFNKDNGGGVSNRHGSNGPSPSGYPR